MMDLIPGIKIPHSKITEEKRINSLLL